MDRYALFFSNSSGENRLAVFDIEEGEWAFDSSELLVSDSSSFDVVGLETFGALLTLNDIDDPSSALSITDTIAASDPFADSGATAIDGIAGSDGVEVSVVEKYAALNMAYHSISYKDAAAIVPVGVYIDESNCLENGGSYGAYWKGLPVKDSATDMLGYAWQYVFQGQVYTYFTDKQDYFSTLGSANVATKTHEELTLYVVKPGVVGNACTLTIVNGAAIAVTITEGDFGVNVYVECVLGVSTTTDVVDAINVAVAAFTLSNDVSAVSLVEAGVSGTGSTPVAAALARTNFAGGVGGHVLTHEDLTGDVPHASVVAKFEAGSDVQLREVNFAHQLASACNMASAKWQDCVGIIDFKAPVSMNRRAISAYLGNTPAYTT